MPSGIPDPRGIITRPCATCGKEETGYATQIGKFCSRSCADAAKVQPMPDRFWSKVAITGPDECWLWIPNPGSDGYGKFWLNGKSVHANNVALSLKLGRPIRPGYHACHNCPSGDNPVCCNPAHLWEGTPGDNSRDMVRKGRSVRGRKRPEHEVKRGSSHGRAVLCEDDVIQMRSSWDGSRDMAKRFAAQYRMTLTPILLLLKRKTWKHVV